MKSLQQILKEYSPDAPAGAGARREIDRNQLRRDLKTVVTRNSIFFWIAVTSAIALFVGFSIMLMATMRDQSTLRNLSTGAGVSLIGAVTWMVNAWKAKVRAELVIALIAHLPESALLSVVSTLSKTI